MKVIFFGTPEFAVATLRMLVHEQYHVVAVVTQPDRPKGRKRILTPSPVKVEALSHQILVLQPEKIKDRSALDEMTQLEPDLIITVAYGQILPKQLLDLPRYGCINVHASLLPKYRGGAPIHYAVMRGDQVTGITIMNMAVGMDTGDILTQCQVPITDRDTTGSMFEKLQIAGAELLKATLPLLLSAQIVPIPQHHDEAIYAPTITRKDEYMDWSRTATELHLQIRGLCPFPGAYTTWQGETMKVWESVRLPESTIATTQRSMSSQTVPTYIAPGTVIAFNDQGIDVLTGEGVLRLTVVQPSGKKSMPVAEFLRGNQITIGAQFGAMDYA